MKNLLVLAFAFAVGPVGSSIGGDCAQIGGDWAVHEAVYLKFCTGGKCETRFYQGNSTVEVTSGSNGCTFSFAINAIDPLSGTNGTLSRTGTVSCTDFSYTGPIGLSVTSVVVYTTNTINCHGSLKDGQIVFNCTGRAAGTIGTSSFTLDIASTSIWQGGPAQVAPVVTTEPADRIAGFGSNITVSVQASGPCLKYQWYRNGTGIYGATNSTLTVRRIDEGDVGAYSVKIFNFAGSVMSREARIDVADLTQPTVSISSPSAGQRVTTNVIRVTGKAADNVGVTKVNLSVNANPVTEADGTTNWSAYVALDPGTNVLLAQSWDAKEQPSKTVSRTVFYAVQTPLVIHLDGSGSVSPNYHGRRLEIGRAYTMTAIPASGWLSAGWTGAEETTAARLRFVHEENLMLTALFVPNPYPPLAGVYRGLFSENPVMRPESSGLLSLTLAGSGAFSGALRNAGQVVSFTGRFDASGNASVTAGGVASNQWQIDLTLALSDGIHQLIGTVQHAGWESAVLAERAVYHSRSNAAPFALRHTFLVSGATDSKLEGAGDGYGSVTTTRSGAATLSGRLADNSLLTLSGAMVRDGYWPVYQSLYSGRGCLFGWLQFNTAGAGGFDGTADWIRPANSNVLWYAGGFTNVSTIFGSAYRAPTSTAGRVLALQTGRAIFSGPPLVNAFTNLFALSARGTVTNLGSNKMILTINPATGQFSGSVRIPGASTDTPVKGAVLQGENRAGGMVQTPWANARLTLEPLP